MLMSVRLAILLHIDVSKTTKNTACWYAYDHEDYSLLVSAGLRNSVSRQFAFMVLNLIHVKMKKLDKDKLFCPLRIIVSDVLTCHQTPVISFAVCEKHSMVPLGRGPPLFHYLGTTPAFFIPNRENRLHSQFQNRLGFPNGLNSCRIQSVGSCQLSLTEGFSQIQRVMAQTEILHSTLSWKVISSFFCYSFGLE